MSQCMNLDLMQVIFAALLVTTSGLNFYHQSKKDNYVHGWLRFRCSTGWKRRRRSPVAQVHDCGTSFLPMQ